MKKVIASCVAMLSLSAFSWANNNPGESSVGMTAYKTAGESTVKLIVVNQAVETVTVRIKNATGRVVYTDVIRNEERFSRKYVFGNDMQNGDYTIEVVNSQGKASQTVTL